AGLGCGACGGFRTCAGFGYGLGTCIGSGSGSRVGCGTGFGARAAFGSGNRAGTLVDLRLDGRAGFRARVCRGSGRTASHRHSVIHCVRAFVGGIGTRLRVRTGTGTIERIACAGCRQPGRIVHTVRRERTRRELTTRPNRRACP
ncbi:TPA: hypothetical protein ACT5CS_003901, partial [Burkholderia cenocepacia]